MTPRFEWDEFFWRASVTLDSWRGYLSCRGPYGSQDSSEPSDGSVSLVFAPEGRGDEPLEDSELALVHWFLDRNQDVSQAVVEGILERYPSLQEEYGYEDEERDEFMPDVHSVEDLRSLVGLHSVNVHQVAKGGVPYVGFEFGCTWDEEHGLGVLMHGTRVVEVGGADTAIHLWIAKQDARGE